MPTAHDLQTLYRDHHGWLREWLRGKLGCAQHAADLAHDTFVRLLRKQAATLPLTTLNAPRAYLATIARALVVDFHRRRTLEAAYLDALAALPAAHAPSPEDRAIVMEALVAIDAMLAGLKPVVRKTFLASQLDGLTYAQIAAELGVTTRSVHNYMVTALTHCYSVVVD